METGRTRRFARRALAAEIFLDDRHGAGELVFESVDVSAAGIFLRSDLLLEVGERFDVEFTLPSHPQRLRVEGRVVRVDTGSDSGAPGMGIEFVNLSGDAERALLDYTRSAD